MRRFATPLFLCCALLLSRPASAGEDRVLHVFTWEEYFSPRAVALFETEQNCTVAFTYYDADDFMLQRMAEGGGYDIVTPSGVDALSLWEQGLALPLDHALLPNMKNLIPPGESKLVDDASRAHDPDSRFSVPYTLTVTGVAYRRDAAPADAVGSWDIFADPRLAGKLAMLNDMREPVGAALRSLGFSVNTTDPEELAQAADRLLAWKENVAMFSLEEARDELLRGRFDAIQTYNGEFTRAAQTDDGLAFFVPEEGSMCSSDQLVIGADTERPELAHAFVDFFLRPDIAAVNMEDMYYYMPNTPALDLVRDRLRNTGAFFLPKEVTDRCEPLRPVGDAAELYDETWSRVLFGD